MVISIGFEILEYSLEHQLPNFSECWWDHVSIFLTLNFAKIPIRSGLLENE
jgi:hypothetical protein